MNRYIIQTLVIILAAKGFSQPKWAQKGEKAIITISTFNTDGELIAKSTGCFISSDGTAISAFSPFRAAARAFATDGTGKEYEVEYMLGANDMYDVAKFKVKNDNKKTAALTMAAESSAEGAKVWIVPYSAKKSEPLSATVVKRQAFQKQYTYYTLSAAKKCEPATPVMNDDGELIGLLQAPAINTDTLSYAVSALFADSLRITALSINDATLNSTLIAKDLPDKEEEAMVSLYIMENSSDSAKRQYIIKRYLEKFPGSAAGYYYKALDLVQDDDFKGAQQIMEEGIKNSVDKAEAHYDYCQVIRQKLTSKTEPYEPWTYDMALAEAQKAYELASQPLYLNEIANILYVKKDFSEACARYLELTQTKLRSAALFFAAASCKEQLGDTLAAITLMDSCISFYGKPYLKEAATYLLVRAQMLYKTGKYRLAINDLNEYEKLMSTAVNDRFYYMRARAETEGRLYQQALDDYAKAISKAPDEIIYYAEICSLLSRFGMYDECIANANKHIALDPQASDGYLFLGLAEYKKGMKEEGLKNLNKAKDLGDTQVDALIKNLENADKAH